MISVVIPAAGRGKRIGLKKQYYFLNRKPVLAYTISIFQKSPLIDEIILVCPNDDLTYCTNSIVKRFKFTKVKKIIPGGKTRQASVFNGLKGCSHESDYILIHDGVRPFFDGKLLPGLISAAKEYKAVVTVLPSTDTVKIVSDGEIIETPVREKVFLAQTPQIFSRNLIIRAYDKTSQEKYTGTDDSKLVERLGEKVRIFIGNEENIKITTPKDLIIAKTLIKKFKL